MFFLLLLNYIVLVYNTHPFHSDGKITKNSESYIQKIMINIFFSNTINLKINLHHIFSSFLLQRFRLVYLLNDIATSYGLFNAEM